jgi:hypothetical protein
MIGAAEVQRGFGRQQRLPVLHRKHAVQLGKQPAGIDGLKRILVNLLERAEKVRSIAPDRSAERATVLPPPVIRLRHVEGRFRRRSRVQRIVSKECERAAGQPVRSTFRDDVHDASARTAVPGAVTHDRKPELLNGVEREHLQLTAHRVVVVVAAVHEVVDVASRAAKHLRRILRPLGRIAMKRNADAWQGRRQVCELTPVERKLFDPPRLDDAADHRRRGLDERVRRRHGDAFLD